MEKKAPTKNLSAEEHNHVESEIYNIEAEKKEFDNEVSNAENIMDLANIVNKHSRVLIDFYGNRSILQSINTAVHNFGYELGKPSKILDGCVRDKAIELYKEERKKAQERNVKLREDISSARTIGSLVDIAEGIGGIQEGEKFYYPEDIQSIIEGYANGDVSEKIIPKILRDRVVRLIGRKGEKEIVRDKLSAVEKEAVINFFNNRVLDFSRYKQWRVDKKLNGGYNKDVLNFLEKEFYDEVVLDKEFLEGEEKRIKYFWKFIETIIPSKIKEFEKKLKEERESLGDFSEEEQGILFKIEEIFEKYVKEAKKEFDFNTLPLDKVGMLVEIQAEIYMRKKFEELKIFLGKEDEAIEFIIKNRNKK